MDPHERAVSVWYRIAGLISREQKDLAVEIIEAEIPSRAYSYRPRTGNGSWSESGSGPSSTDTTTSADVTDNVNLMLSQAAHAFVHVASDNPQDVVKR